MERRIRRQGIAWLRCWHASLGQSWRVAGYVHLGRAYGYAAGAWALRNCVGTALDAWPLCPHGFYAREAGTQLYFSHEANSRPDIRLDFDVGAQSYLRWPAGGGERGLHTRRVSLARQPHS